MTKRELDELVNERVNELCSECRKKYLEGINYEQQIIIDRVKETQEKIQDVIKASGFSCYPYSLSNIIIHSIHDTPSSKKCNDECQEIRNEGQALKKRLVVMGLKNKAVADILMKYLGLEK